MLLLDKKIGLLLHPYGFKLSYTSDTDVVYAKRIHESLFSRLCIWASDKHKASSMALSTSTQCSIVPGRTAIKGLCIDQYVALASSDDHGWSHVNDPERADAFWDNLVSTGVEMAQGLAVREGRRLLTSTATLRRASEVCLSAIPDLGNLARSIDIMLDRASPEDKSRYDQLAKEPMILIPNGSVIYDAAILAVASSGHWNHEDAGIATVNNRSSILMIQYIASKLAREEAWSQPIEQMPELRPS